MGVPGFPGESIKSIHSVGLSFVSLFCVAVCVARTWVFPFVRLAKFLFSCCDPRAIDSSCRGARGLSQGQYRWYEVDFVLLLAQSSGW